MTTEKERALELYREAKLEFEDASKKFEEATRILRQEGILIEEVDSKENKKIEIEKKVEILLLNLGFSASKKGFEYIKTSIEFLKVKSYKGKFIKGLFTEVAEMYNSTWYNVERCIKLAIIAAWPRGDCELQKKIFGADTSKIGNFPTNTQFLNSITEYIKLYE